MNVSQPKTDEQLLHDFVAGERAALGDLAQRYETALLGLATGLLSGRRDLAADAVQETWVRVIRFGKSYMGRSSLKTWLYRIAVNQCRSLATPPGLPTAAADPETPATDGATDTPAVAADRNHAVRRAVAQLDADKRFVVLLCYHANMTHAEAAEVLELPLGTLKSRLHAALTELRTLLSAEAKP